MPATRRTKKSASTRKEPEAQLQNKRWVWTRPRDMARLKKKRGKVSAAGSISQSMLQLGIGESISPNWDDVSGFVLWLSPSIESTIRLTATRVDE